MEEVILQLARESEQRRCGKSGALVLSDLRRHSLFFVASEFWHPDAQPCDI
jgi:hypothetical protein